MLARLGNVLYWLGCVLAVFVFFGGGADCVCFAIKPTGGKLC